MLARIRQIVAAPVYQDEERARVARLLNIVVSTLFVASGACLVIIALYVGLPSNAEEVFTLGSAAIFTLLTSGLWVLARRGHLRVASFLLLSSLWAIITYWIVASAGISSDSSVMVFPLIVVLAGLLLGGRAAIVYTVMSILAGLGAYYAESTGQLVVIEAPLSLIDLLVMGFALVLTGLLLRHAMNSMLGALERARTNERAQTEANRELEIMRASLEQRVADRTADLERRSLHLQTAVEVSRAATSVLDPNALIWQVTEVIRERFELYHVGLFLVDATGEWAEYRAGAGASGKRLAEEGFRLEVGGQSMVGWCTAHSRVRIAQDVSRETARFEHPDVPRTRSEAALPLVARGQVIGALSLQSDQLDAFNDQTVASLQTMADQVAVALDNARLFRETQEALEATRRAYGELSREAWSELLRARADWGYAYTHRAVLPAEGEWLPEMIQARQTGSMVEGGDGKPTLAVPLQVRDQVIGALAFSKESTGETWTAAERELLEILVQQLGVALESAQLFQESQRRTARERLTSEITTRIRETLDLETMLKTTAQEIRQALELPEVIVRLTAQPPSGRPDRPQGLREPYPAPDPAES
jgi:GAF domain-containing protein